MRVHEARVLVHEKLLAAKLKLKLSLCVGWFPEASLLESVMYTLAPLAFL